MFKSITAAILLSTIVTASIAQGTEPKNLYTVSECVNIDIASELLEKEYGEKPFALGTAFVEIPEYGEAEGVLVITVNPKTRTYTINIIFEEDNMVCIILSGDGFEPAGRPPEASL